MSKWFDMMKDYLASDEYKELQKQVCWEYKEFTVFPPKKLIYNALKLTPYENVKCVIIGQDPYHNEGQAMGLSFSVNDGVDIPPSLKNIYKEIDAEYHCGIPETGNLTCWAKQGVLLLNAILTVRAHEPASHHNIGWENCTDEIIKTLEQRDEPIVYMLWGNFAKEKKKLITNKNRLILESGHPSPLSARFFLGNGHFKKCNEFLKENDVAPIDWFVKY